DGKLIGLQESDGALRWQLRRDVPGLSLRGDPEPVIHDDFVITGFASGKLLANELESGRVAWEVNAATPRGRNEIERLIDVEARPILVGSVLYVAAYQGQLTALATGSRRVLWTLEISSYRDIEADADNIYVVDGKDTITAVNRLTGQTVWQQEGLQRRRVTAPLAFSNFVVVADAEGYMHVLDRQTGVFAGRIRIGRDGVRVTPIEIDGRVYVVSMNGSLTSVEIQ
ncbi:MAG: PQQ-binding-like beta-propeller repeat protein, partial [Gammaproteobacteria bacterium]|nr:PQQ-binding-like beta-propeller repeat protein [Gammaproteobacteria bacterium]